MKFVRGAALIEGETFCLHCFIGRRIWANTQKRQIFHWNWSILFKRKHSPVSYLHYSPFAVVIQFLTSSYLRGKSRCPFRQEPCRTSLTYLDLLPDGFFSVRHISHQFLNVSHFIPLAHRESGSAVIALTSPLDFRVPSELPEVSVSHLLPCREKGRNGAGFLSTS